MIRQNTRNAVAPVLRNLVKSNLSLESVEGTPIGSMVESITIAEPDAVVETIAVEPGSEPTQTDVVNAVLDATVEQSENSPVHSIVGDELISRGTAVFGEAIFKTQTVVVPMIGQLIDNVTHNLAVSFVPPHSVVQISMPALMAHPQVIAMMENGAAAATQQLRAINGLAPLSEEQLVEYLETGSAELNDLIADTIANHQPGWLVYVYDSLLRNSVVDCGAELPLTFYDNTQRRVSNTLDTMDAVVVAAVLAGNIAINPPEGLTQTPEELDAATTDLRICLAHAWAIVANAITDMVKSDYVVLSPWLTAQQPKLTEIFVLAEQYTKALDAGVTPETLLGGKIENAQLALLPIAVLAEKREEYSTAWSKYLAEYETRGTLNASAELSVLVLDQFRALLDNDRPQAEGYDIDTVMAKAKDYLNNYGITQENLYDVAVKLVAEFAYGCYKSEHIIYHMDKVMSTNPTMAPRTAAYLAAIDMITDWAVKQLK